MKPKVYSLDGKAKGSVELPDVFTTEYRPDLIRRAVVATQASRRQQYSTDILAGLRTSAEYYGRRAHGSPFRQTINRGMSRLPREKSGGGGLGKVRRVPHSVGGRRAHPPHGKDYSKKINSKEYEAALRSAIAATVNKELVSARGHIVSNFEMPLILEDTLQSVSKTKELMAVLTSLGLNANIEKSAERKINAGRAKLRGRKRKTKRSILFVVKEDKGLGKAASNLPGVDCVTLDSLDVEALAPGTHAGRLTVWSASALENLGKKWTLIQ